MALMEITVIPIGTPSSSLGDYIAEVVAAVEKEGINHTLTDMGTLIEGDVDDLLQLAGRLHETPFEHNIQRVVTTITIDDRRDKKVNLGDKITSVISRIK